MKETGLTGKRRSTTIAATPTDDGKSQRKRRSNTRVSSFVTQGVLGWISSFMSRGGGMG